MGKYIAGKQKMFYQLEKFNYIRFSRLDCNYLIQNLFSISIIYFLLFCSHRVTVFQSKINYFIFKYGAYDR